MSRVEKRSGVVFFFSKSFQILHSLSGAVWNNIKSAGILRSFKGKRAGKKFRCLTVVVITTNNELKDCIGNRSNLHIPVRITGSRVTAKFSYCSSSLDKDASNHNSLIVVKQSPLCTSTVNFVPSLFMTCIYVISQRK